MPPKYDNNAALGQLQLGHFINWNNYHWVVIKNVPHVHVARIALFSKHPGGKWHHVALDLWIRLEAVQLSDAREVEFEIGKIINAHAHVVGAFDPKGARNNEE